MADPLVSVPLAGDFIASEANGFRSREIVEIAADQDLAAGTVLAALTANGEHVPFNPAGADGSEDAVCILIYPVKTEVGQTKMAAVMARDCEVNAMDLVFVGTVTLPQKTAAFDALAAFGIIARHGSPAVAAQP